MRSSIILLLLIWGGINCVAQDGGVYSYESADSITYQQYISRNFKDLQRTGENILNQEIDFFYLRMRLGISYYESNNYEAAIAHFRRAYEMSPTDDAVQEYYYYSLLFTGRKEAAHDLAAAGNERIQKLSGYSSKDYSTFARTFETIAVTGGLLLTDHTIGAATTDYKSDGVYAENTVQGLMSMTSFHISNAVTNRWKIKNYFSVFSVSSLGVVQSFLPTVVHEYTNRSYQYNFTTDYTFENGFSAGAALGVYKEQSSRLAATFDPSNITPTYYDYVFDHTAVTAGMYGSYRSGNVSVLVSALIGNFSNKSQAKGETAITYYPFGNQNYYATASLAVVKNDTVTNAITALKLGAKLLPMVWCEIKGSYGNHQNYSGALGVESYNTVEPIKLVTGIGLIFVWRGMTLQPYYTLQQREMSYIRYETLTSVSTIKSTYFNQLFTTTISWNL